MDEARGEASDAGNTSEGTNIGNKTEREVKDFPKHTRVFWEKNDILRVGVPITNLKLHGGGSEVSLEWVKGTTFQGIHEWTSP